MLKLRLHEAKAEAGFLPMSDCSTELSPDLLLVYRAVSIKISVDFKIPAGVTGAFDFLLVYRAVSIKISVDFKIPAGVAEAFNLLLYYRGVSIKFSCFPNPCGVLGVFDILLVYDRRVYIILTYMTDRHIGDSAITLP